MICYVTSLLYFWSQVSRVLFRSIESFTRKTKYKVLQNSPLSTMATKNVDNGLIPNGDNGVVVALVSLPSVYIVTIVIIRFVVVISAIIVTVPYT